MKYSAFFCLAVLAATVSSTVLYHESFDGDWESRWVTSQEKSDYGKFVSTAGKWYADADKKGIQTSQDAHFYAIGSTFPEFSNQGKDFVVQLVVKHEQKLDCGGGYIKLLPAGTDLEHFHGETRYNIMFGPDICGPPKKLIHVFFNYNGENLLWKKEPKAETDELSHLYTLVVHPDNTYSVSVDNKEVGSGKLEDDWDFLEPKEINDPHASKPSDWEDKEYIADPNDTKPDDWDDEPSEIADPNAEKPDDWEDGLDGEWEPPMIDNPKHKGDWKAKQIKNDKYKGPWVHPKIANPDYVADSDLYAYPSFGAVAIDIWQVKSGSIFDDIQIYDDVEEAKKWAVDVFLPAQAAEKEMFNKIEADRKEKEDKERKDREAERKRREEEAKADSEEEEEEDDGEDDAHDHDHHHDHGHDDL